MRFARQTSTTPAMALFLCAALFFATSGLAANADLGAGATTGAVDLESIGPITFGEDGVLFVADSTAAVIYALDTSDNDAAPARDFAIEELDSKVAAVLGTTADDVAIRDLAVNPRSHVIYLSISRGQGDAAQHGIAKISASGEVSLLDLSQIRHARASLADAPTPEQKDRRGRSLRREALTDLEFHQGTLLVTGLSNEEFSSKLRKFSFPFSGVAGGTNVEIFHGAHGRWETNAPVRTMTVYEQAGKPTVLAAYTCTPLVKFPLGDLADGAKVHGTTVAELGNRNRPLDMFVYSQDGTDYVLMANSSRGVMKIDLATVSTVEEITERVADTAGLPYETISELVGIEQLARYGKDSAVVLAKTDAGVNLRSLALP